MAKKDIDPEKLLDMIRSILPSTARRAARREKAIENREVRRRVRLALHSDDLETSKKNLHERAVMTYIVGARRGADKLNHFMRWCESWTRGMTDRQALDAVRAILPRNLIGDHAFSHWETHVKVRRRPHRTGSYREQAERRFQSLYDKTRHRLRQLLSVDPDFQRRLNAAIRERKLEGEPRRMLLGVHDIDAFVRDLLTCCEFNLERRVLLELLERRAGFSPPSRRAEARPTYEIGTRLAALRRT